MTTLVSPLSTARTGDQSGFVKLSVEDQFVQNLIRPLFPAHEEMVVIAGFDQALRLKQLIEIATGTAKSCQINPRHWQSLLSGRHISHAILVHNHPSGIARPSQADIHLTREAAAHLQFFAINLTDHLILVTTGHFSFVRAGLL